MYYRVGDSPSDEISDDNEVQLRPNSPYALPYRERTKEQDRLNRQAFSENGRDYPIWTTHLRVFRTKTSFT